MTDTEFDSGPAGGAPGDPDGSGDAALPLPAAPPRAAAFIVTIYGDVVEPRGGVLWMGTLIACAADHGLSESLVRTAVSRLVAAGRLEGERIGRRSYYRLTRAAQREFAAASRILYAPPPPPGSWLLALGGAAAAAAELEGWARIGPEAAWAPDRPDLPRPEGVVLAARGLAGEAGLPDLAARHWPLDEVAERYRSFETGFAPLRAALADGARPSGARALALRLRLVHLYRQAALADPRLPGAALPGDWPGHHARALFVETYLALTEAADAHVGRAFHGDAGPLPALNPQIAARRARLAAEARGGPTPESITEIQK
ncbi:PaaX family transcriptional regulator C-terminal domain-containing protein [Roseivivax sp. CAU 1761]